MKEVLRFHPVDKDDSMRKRKGFSIAVNFSEGKRRAALLLFLFLLRLHVFCSEYQSGVLEGEVVGATITAFLPVPGRRASVCSMGRSDGAWLVSRTQLHIRQVTSNPLVGPTALLLLLLLLRWRRRLFLLLLILPLLLQTLSSH